MKKYTFFFSIFACAVLFFSFTENALAGSVTLKWNANSEQDIANYKLYYGTTTRTGNCPRGGYSNSINVGNVTTYTLSNLTNNRTYYFSLTAIDTSNNESCFSTQISRKVPAKDTRVPNVSVFNIPRTATSLTVNILTLTATDNVAVTQYCLRESSSSASCVWGEKPTTYTFATDGTKRLYAFARDAAGNISVGRSDLIIIKLPATTSICNSFSYSEWTTCTDNLQSRTVISSTPTACVGGTPILSQTCTLAVATLAPTTAMVSDSVMTQSTNTVTTPEQEVPSATVKYTFTAQLKYGDSHADVKALQQFLNTKGYTVATTGPGSKGKETEYFGPATRAAVTKFQQANNIGDATSYGFVGPKTRAKLQEIQG
ncbi:MAG: Fibronectin, type III domain protein [Parcubacteria group bacterium GW2011_GWA2_43_11]|nr:MAG: Fibronectin, type III domain protein [Parcubacteria group bacterium GW2011_GWC2_42_11]KKS86000.1 MAG: Fibronectin, type III domain protein [Parcubacteria group bacterium GW2011_GWA2_43_11]